MPKPRWMPLRGRRSALVSQTTRRRRLVRGTHRGVLGTLEAVEQVCAAWGWPINPSGMERLPLPLRQHVAAMGRRVHTWCQGEDGLRQQVARLQVSDNFVLPHASLRQALAQPEPPKGMGAATQGRPRPPARAAGRSDHVWTLREVLLLRVPPWPPPAGVCARRGGGKRSETLVGAGDVRPHRRRRGRPQGGEGR